jgi:ribonuclease E
MIKRMLINATHADELRVAITADAALVDLDIEHPGQEQKKSNIYKGRITSIEPSLGAVFVDYGSERHGFLPLKEISPEYFVTPQNTESLADIDIRRALKEGQEIVVQVDKEERGTKGAALTTFIALAGCYLVLMPNNPDSGGISRRIEGEDRDQLREIIEQLPIPDGMGIIIRTAGVSRSKDELEWDLKVLLRYWEAIKQAAVAKPGPYLIHQESDVIIRAVRDHLRQDISEVIIDDQSAFHRAKEYIRQVRPDFIDHIKLYTDTMPLFSRFQIERQIEAAYQREVRLPSGGSIVIDHSEALVAIDINSARATKGASIEETALQTNLEAADEIAKQLRIRDIGGLVVIDFIDMTPTRNQREVENRLRNALRLDRARIQIGRISRFGLLEMSRQRLRASLSISTEISCPRCEGRGSIRSVESVAISIVHLIQEQASRNGNSHIQVQLPVDIATFMVNEKRGVLTEIETQSPVKVTIIPNRHLKSPHYHLKTTKDEHSKLVPSYKLVKVPRADAVPQKPTLPTNVSEPAIQKYLTDELQVPPPKKTPGNGLIKRLWDVMFGGENQTKKPAPKYPSAKPSAQRIQPVRESDDSARSEQRKPQQPARAPQQADNRNKPKRPQQPQQQQKRDDRNRPPRDNRDRNRDNRDNRGNRDNRDNRDNRATQNTPVEAPIAAAPAHHVEAPVVEITKPVLPSVTETRVEKVMHAAPEKSEPVAAPKAEPVKAEPVVAKPEPVIPAAPAVPAEKYQSNYKGLSSGKPLQQVTTKKVDSTDNN